MLAIALLFAQTAVEVCDEIAFVVHPIGGTLGIRIEDALRDQG